MGRALVIGPLWHRVLPAIDGRRLRATDGGGPLGWPSGKLVKGFSC